MAVDRLLARRRSVLLLALGAGVPAALGLAAGPATADPALPAQGDVDAARAAAAGVAAQVAALQARLAGQQADLDASRTLLSVAAEDYDEARALLARRDDEAAAAAARASRAQADYAAARQALGRFAASRYRGDSAGLGAFAAVLAANGPQELIDRTAALDRIGAQRDDVEQRLDAARVWARASEGSAATARAAQQRATDATAAAQADALVAATRTRTDALVAELAVLQ
ncbi:hypothetical protein GTR02_16435, partial [Kineococcus sp. R8]